MQLPFWRRQKMSPLSPVPSRLPHKQQKTSIDYQPSHHQFLKGYEPGRRKASLDGFLRIGCLCHTSYLIFRWIRTPLRFNTFEIFTPCWRHASNSDIPLHSVSPTLDTGHEPKTGIIGRDRCVLGYTSLGILRQEDWIGDKDVSRGIYWCIYTASRSKRRGYS